MMRLFRRHRLFAGLFAFGLLAIPHLGVEAVAGQQARMIAALDDAALVEHDDLVGVDDRREAVGLSSALVASSRISTGGFLRSVRAIATRCFSPPESFSPRSPTRVS
jgi:hypothetical protein